MSIFDKLSGAKVQGRGIKIAEDGVFVVSMDEIKFQESNNDFGTLFIVEFTVEQSSTENHPPGSGRSWVQMPEKRGQTDLGNVKAFIGALLGVDAQKDEIAPEAFQTAVDPSQPYKGKKLLLRTQRIITKSNRPFTVHDWSPVKGDENIVMRPGVSPAPAMPAAASAPAAPEPSGVAPQPPAPPAPPAAPEPPPPPPLTKETWLSGVGPAVPHPGAPGWEYNPDHRDWGSRKVQS